MELMLDSFPEYANPWINAGGDDALPGELQ